MNCHICQVNEANWRCSDCGRLVCPACTVRGACTRCAEEKTLPLLGHQQSIVEDQKGASGERRVRCSQCGQTNSPVAKFCSKCGKRVGDPANENEAGSNSTIPRPVLAATGYQSNRGRNVLIGWIILALVCSCGVLVLIASITSSESTSAGTSSQVEAPAIQASIMSILEAPPVLRGKKSWRVVLNLQNRTRRSSGELITLSVRLVFDDGSYCDLLLDGNIAGTIIPPGETRQLSFYGDDESWNDSRKPDYVSGFYANQGMDFRANVRP